MDANFIYYIINETIKCLKLLIKDDIIKSRTPELLNGAKINPILGVEGKVQDAIDNLLAGTLEGGKSIYSAGTGKGYSIDKSVCDYE